MSLERYSLPEALPSSELVTVSSMQPYLFASGRAPFDAHLHSFNQIIWFRTGTGTHLIDLVEHAYEPNTVFYIPHGAVHAFRKDPAASGVILHFDDVMAILSGGGQTLPGVLRSMVFGSSLNRTLCPTDAAALDRSFGVLSDELECDEVFGRSAAIEAALRLLLVRVSRYFQETFEPRSPDHQRYLAFLELVEHHFTEGLSVETYARKLGVSSKTLSRAVRAASSRSPSQNIADRVALEMKRLLVHTNLSVKEIAAKLGIDDASYATRFFRKQSGVAPSVFRDRWR